MYNRPKKLNCTHKIRSLSRSFALRVVVWVCEFGVDKLECMCCYVQRKNHAQSTYHLLVLRFRADKYLLLKRPYHIYEMKQGNEYEYTANCTCCAESASDVPFSSSSSSYKNRSVFFVHCLSPSILPRFRADVYADDRESRWFESVRFGDFGCAWKVPISVDYKSTFFACILM